jgi:hypothetical protein
VRRAARTDANQAAIVAALRAAGCSVLDTSSLGRGFPDLVVGTQGRTLLVEVKDGSKPPSARRLTDAHQTLHSTWRGGAIAVVTDIDSAMRAVRVTG